jgi:hypothetical protein
MKSKKSLYILLPAVLLLWGYIAFKIYKHMSGGGEVIITSNRVIQECIEDNVPDTFSLILDYKDPFLSRNIIVPNTSKNRVRKVKPTIKHIHWPEIIYQGRMVNQQTKRSKVSLSVGGVDVILSIGETKNEIKLMKSYADSIKVQFQGEMKTIHKK